MNSQEINDTLSRVEAQEPLTEAEYRRYMNQFWTRRLPVTEACGHKIDVDSQLNTNCITCWFTWFNLHKELVALCDEIVQKHGPETIVRMRGKKFWKFFTKYMAAVEITTAEKEKQDGASSSGVADVAGSGGSDSTAERNDGVNDGTE